LNGLQKKLNVSMKIEENKEGRQTQKKVEKKREYPV
jgi:hypothetical protein